MEAAKRKLLEQTHKIIIEEGLKAENPKRVLRMTSPNVIGLGTTYDEKIVGLKELKALLKRQKEQGRGLNFSYKLTNLGTHISEDENTAVFIDEIALSITTDGETIKMVIRFSTVLEYIKNQWLLVHWHSSKPEEVESEKDTWGIETWKEKAEALEKEVAERTADLVLKNRDLAIEAALERVRARSMAMHSSDELNQVVAVLFENLKELQIPVTAAGIQVYLEDSEDMLNYVCGENSEGLVISHYRMPYFDNAIINDFKDARDKKDGFFVGNYSKQVKDSFYHYLFENTEIKNVPEDIKQMIFDSEAYTISMAAVSNSLIAINDFKGNELSENHVEIIKRFAKMFEQAYIRFRDLQKAEAQAREAQIEAALEKVRSRSMAMHNSQELKEVALELRKQMGLLGQKDLEVCAIHLYGNDEDSFESWSAMKASGSETEIVQTQAHFPKRGIRIVDEMVHHYTIGTKDYILVNEGEKIAEWFKVLKKHAPELHASILDSIGKVPVKQLKANWAVADFTGGALVMVTYGEPDEVSRNLLRRSANVFEQAYVRFLDLQKAEAQAREAQIEAALEKVRSRSLGMQHSNEMQQVANEVHQQLRNLGVDIDAMAMSGVIDNESDYDVWVGGEDYDKPLRIPYNNDTKVQRDYNKAIKERPEHFTKTYKGKTKDAYFEHLMATNAFNPKLKKMMLECSAFTTTLTFMKNSGMQIIRYNDKAFSDKDNSIVKRFGRVFEQAYIRFLDLEKAEAQTREAQIEAALEKVRSRSIGMQKSIELLEVISVVSQQLQTLGFRFSHVSFINNSLKEQNSFWVAATGLPNPMRFIIPYKAMPMLDNLRKAQKNKDAFYTNVSTIKEHQEWFKHLLKHSGENVFPKEIIDYQMSKGLARSISIHTNIMLALANTQSEPYSDYENKIIARFGQVFEQSYTRFLDLQRAEAQVKEAQIEAALERVRSRSMGMQKSEELEEIIQVVFDQFIQLGITVDHSGFIMDYKSRDDMHIWLADKHKITSQITLPYFDSPHWNSYNEAKKKRDNLFLNHLNFKEKNKFYKQIFKYVPDLPEDAKTFYLQCPSLTIATTLADNIGLYIENYSGIQYSEDDQKTLIRFGRVFQQTYTRFLDLKKAEAQAREAQIEAALEKVRSRTMAMQKSEELPLAANNLFLQVQELGIPAWSAGYCIWQDDKYNANCNMSSEGEIQKGFILPSIGEGYDFFTPQENGEPFYAKELGGEALVKHYEFMKQLPNMGEILKELIDAGLELPTFQIFHIVYFKFGYVMFITYEEVPKAHDIFKRFGQVFEQTYTRFLDLERAEAQAREAKIEMALEKVRSRTMAMQHSDELKDAAQVLFNEVQNLGIPSWSCGYNILSDDKTSAECYMSSEGALQKPFTLYYDQEKSFIEQYNFFKSKKTFLVQEQKGKDLEEAYAYMKTIPRIGEIITDLEEEGISLPTHQFNHLCKFNKGYLLFITYEQVPEAHDLFVRFTKVFEQTYTRFLDLKKAEAQAREAKIETALERVRSQSMSMQGSEELSTTTQVFHQQLQLLGIDSEFSYLWLPEEDEKHQVFWATWSQNHNNHDDYHTKKVRYPLDKSEPSIAACYAAWESEEPVHVNAVKPEEVKDYFKTWSELLTGVDKFQPKLFQEGLYYIDAYMSYGCFGIMVKQSLSDNEKTILNRFSTEFQRTYTRFLDLQKAEAQAREAQIEAALERVRSQSMGMQSTADFAEVTTEMFNQLRNFGEDLFATGIVFCDKHDGHVEQWHSIPGGSMLSPMIVPIDLDYIHQYRYDQWKAGEDLFSIEIPSDFINLHFEDIFKLPSAQITLKDLESRNAPMPETPDWEIDYGASFKNGYILISSLKPLQNTDILPRFAKVFEQAYTRFLDLQTAEKNTYKSRVETALERVRARALAMQEPDELRDVASVLRTEMGLLGIEELETCSIYILDKDVRNAECWYALKDAKSKSKQLISDHISMDFTKTWVGKQMLNFHDSKNETTSIAMKGDQRKEWIQYCAEQSEALQSYYSDDIPERTYHLHKFSNGAIGAASASDISEESWVLLKRCASVFSLAYSRFKDLMQAKIDLKRLKTEKKRAEEALSELQTTQKQLIQSEKMASLGELTAGIAHEIQNPLNFVNNFSEVSKELLEEMKEEIENGDFEEVKAIMNDIIQNLDKINHHGQRADGIVKGMLQHSRASGDKKEPTDINALADEYLRLAYHGLRAKDKSFNAQLIADFDDGIGKVAVIPQDIGRVVLNLLTNALYAVHEKAKENLKNFEPTVSIKTKKTQDSFILEVKDNGNGMPNSVKEKIFQPFFTTKPTGEGTGLGLSLSYDIITKGHGGDLYVNTAEGKGSEFTIKLPIVQ